MAQAILPPGRSTPGDLGDRLGSAVDFLEHHEAHHAVGRRVVERQRRRVPDTGFQAAVAAARVGGPSTPTTRWPRAARAAATRP